MTEELRLMRLAVREIETIRGELQRLAGKLDQPGYRDFRNRVDKASSFAGHLLTAAIRCEIADAETAPAILLPNTESKLALMGDRTRSGLRLVVDNTGGHAA